MSQMENGISRTEDKVKNWTPQAKNMKNLDLVKLINNIIHQN